MEKRQCNLKRKCDFKMPLSCELMRQECGKKNDGNWTYWSLKGCIMQAEKLFSRNKTLNIIKDKVPYLLPEQIMKHIWR